MLGSLRLMKEGLFAVLGLAIAVLVAVIVYQNHRRFHRPLITTPYQAVALVNGDVFYGRIDHLGSDHPVLRDVFVLRTELDPETNQPRHVILRRKDETTGADHIIFVATAIAFIEPVLPDSTIGRLIEQAGSR